MHRPSASERKVIFMKYLRKSAFAATAVVAAALVQVSCGGGIGELAVAAFLGTGGGQFVLEPQPLPTNYGIFDDTLTFSRSATQVDTTPPSLYASGYDVFVSGVSGARLTACNGAKGRVEGDRVTIAGCFTGRYVNVNRLVSDDGTKVLYHQFDPDLTTGLWVDVNDSSHAVKFVGTTVACEYVGAVKRAGSYQRRLANVSQTANGRPFVPTTAGITSLAVTGGQTWTGEFIGISGLRLTSGTTSVDLQRRDLPPPAACP